MLYWGYNFIPRTIILCSRILSSCLCVCVCLRDNLSNFARNAFIVGSMLENVYKISVTN